MEQYPGAGSVSAVQTEFTLKDAAAIFVRRRRLVLLVWLFCFMLALVKCVLSTRRFESHAAIQIQKDDSDTLGMETTLGSAESGASDALDYNITLQTQARVLGSDTLALAVINSLDLEKNDDFTGMHAWLTIPPWLTPWNRSAPEPAGVPLEKSPDRRRRTLKTFAKRLKIQIEPGTRIINISFLSTDPVKAAEVVNRLIAEYMEYNFDTRSTATARVSEWLKKQLDGLAKEASTAQARVLALQSVNGLFAPDERHNDVLMRFDELNRGVVAAEENRILAQAFNQVVASGDPEAVGSFNIAGSGTSATAASSLTLVQQLRAKESELNAQLQENLEKFGRNYPLVLEQQTRLQSLRNSLQDENSRIAQRAQSEFQVSLLAEKASRQSLEAQRNLIRKLSGNAMDYVVAKEDADASRELLEDLKKKVEDAKLLSGLRSNSVTIVDPGRAPSSRYPKQPSIPLTVAGGVLAGLVFGAIAAFLVDKHDKGIYSVDQLESLLGTPPFAVLPSFEVHRGWPRTLPQLHARARLKSGSEISQTVSGTLIPLDPDSTYAEALRSLRTSLLLSRSQQHPKVILVTSAHPGEGKSVTTLHLATILGQQGRRVLVIDGDLRRSSLHQKLAIPNEVGLSTMLSEMNAPTALRSMGGRDDVWILTAGPRPPYPAELLSAPRMLALLEEWRANFDFILIDTPPALPVTDALLLSPVADITLLIARQHVSTMHGIKSAFRKLSNHRSQGDVAVIFNGLERTSADLADLYSYGYEYGKGS